MSAWVWETTLTVAILCAGALVASRRPRFGAAVAHGLWLVALLKFLMPPMISWPLPKGTGSESAAVASAAEAQPAAIATAAIPTRKVAGPPPREAGLAATREVAAKAAPPPIAKGRPSASPADPRAGWRALAEQAGRYAPIAWGASAAAIGLWSLGRIARFQRKVRRAGPAPSWLADLVAESAGTMEVAPPRVRVAPGLPSPLLWCWGRPTMLIPEHWLESVPSAQLRGAIGHELAHLARRDHWVSWLELIAGVIWWWHPLLHIVRRGLRETADASCDARVVAAWPEGRRDYAELLIDACRADTSGPSLSPALGLGGPGRAFERRLTMIMKPGPRPRLSRPGRLALIALALAAFPAWSSGGPPRSSPRDHSSQVARSQQSPAPEARPTDEELLAELKKRLRVLTDEYQKTVGAAEKAKSELVLATQELEKSRQLHAQGKAEESQIQAAAIEIKQAQNELDREGSRIARQREAIKDLNQEMSVLAVKIEEQKKAEEKRAQLAAEIAKKLDAMEGDLQASLLAAEKAYQGKLKPPAVIEPGDILNIEVLEALPGRPIKGEHRVRGDGTISLGFYGDIRIAGLNRIQIKEKVISHLRKYLNDEVLGLYSSTEDGKLELIKPADSDRVSISELYVKNDPATHTSLDPRAEGHTEQPNAIAKDSGGDPAPKSGGEQSPQIVTFGGSEESNALPQIRVIQPGDTRSEATWEALDQNIEIPFKDPTPIKDAIEYIGNAMKASGAPEIEFYLDKGGLEEAGVTEDEPVSLDLKRVRVKIALQLMLHQLKLTYIIRDGLVIITRPDNAATDFEIVPEGQPPGLQGGGGKEGGIGGMF